MGRAAGAAANGNAGEGGRAGDGCGDWPVPGRPMSSQSRRARDNCGEKRDGRHEGWSEVSRGTGSQAGVVDGGPLTLAALATIESEISLDLTMGSGAARCGSCIQVSTVGWERMALIGRQPMGLYPKPSPRPHFPSLATKEAFASSASLHHPSPSPVVRPLTTHGHCFRRHLVSGLPAADPPKAHPRTHPTTI